MLQKSGWKEGQGLGILEKSIKVPILAILKTDRVGLGMIAAQGERRKRNDGPILAKKKGKRERRREREIAEEAEAARGKGRTGMARDYHRDERERKAMLNYMNQ